MAQTAAPSAKVQQTKVINEAANVALRERTGDLKNLRQQYMREPRVTIYLSPMYRPHFGRNMNVDVNGISIFFPVDGRPYEVPQTFADEITRRRMAIDAILTKQDRMANIQNNFEGAPGELKMF